MERTEYYFLRTLWDAMKARLMEERVLPPNIEEKCAQIDCLIKQTANGDLSTHLQQIQQHVAQVAPATTFEAVVGVPIFEAFSLALAKCIADSTGDECRSGPMGDVFEELEDHVDIDDDENHCDSFCAEQHLPSIEQIEETLRRDDPSALEDPEFVRLKEKSKMLEAQIAEVTNQIAEVTNLMEEGSESN